MRASSRLVAPEVPARLGRYGGARWLLDVLGVLGDLRRSWPGLGVPLQPRHRPVSELLPWDPLGSSGILPSIVTIATWRWLGYNEIIFYDAPRHGDDPALPVRRHLEQLLPPARHAHRPRSVPTTLGLYQWSTRVTQFPDYSPRVITGSLIAPQRQWRSGLATGGLR
jgi:hypothetical protein